MERALRWDAQAYDAASSPQRAWGLALLDLRAWRGDETVLDAGCGPGGLAQDILLRVPRGRVVAVDNDPEMVAAAKRRLAPFAERVRVQMMDVARIAGVGPFDVVYSNAVLHWVADHDAAFASFFRVLEPGGELLAQCGGSGNIDRVKRIADELAARTPYAPGFAAWARPWHFETAEATRARLDVAGFTDVRTTLQAAPVRFEDRAAFARFVPTAPLLPYLSRLDDAHASRFLADFLGAYERAGHGWELDYVRLTIRARRPPA